MSIRIGQGYDIHRMVEGRPCIIGGVRIEHSHGPDGHSDADPLLHAIIDAILGAAGLGDIGEHFPDNDPAYAGADSRVLLKQAAASVAGAGWNVVNIDASVLAEAPKLKPYKAAMREVIGGCIGIPAARVNVKGKTNEGFDAVGLKQAIAVHAVALLERKSEPEA